MVRERGSCLCDRLGEQQLQNAATQKRCGCFLKSMELSLKVDLKLPP